MPPVSGPDATGRPAAAPFVPRRGRVVPVVVGVVVLVAAVALAISLPEQYQLVDRLMTAGIGVATAALMSRYATIRAVPYADGLFVRNIGAPRLVPWEEIEAVRFSEGMPWPRVDLADGDDLAVMAIQRADGGSSRDEAQRLADLVAQPPRA